MTLPKWWTAELVGTFLLVFFGCGSVATSIAFGAPVGLFQVAIIWGLGLTLAIFLTAHHSGAHLNPAITIAFAVWSDFPKSRIGGYVVAQMLGAFLAAAAVYALFGGKIAAFELLQGIERGGEGSEATAMIFGEYFPNPSGAALTDELRKAVSLPRALFAEFMGTALLALAIFGLTAKENEAGPRWLVPFAIGMSLTTLIAIFAPLTMAGFNPARDLAPRIFSALAGWGSLPFSVNGSGWLTVYILAPIAGALFGGWVARRIFAR